VTEIYGHIDALLPSTIFVPCIVTTRFIGPPTSPTNRVRLLIVSSPLAENSQLRRLGGHRGIPLH
jgi:hypothetical protein